jgi:prepilin-type N-terminal cleavage/methylation domain-containing protein
MSQPLVQKIGGQESGFTLVEVMIAMLLLLIGMTGVALAQIQALRSNNFSAQRSKALYLAEEGLENFHAMSFINAALTNPGVVQDPANPIQLNPNDEDVTQYYRCWQVTPDVPRIGVSTIVVEVRVGDPACNPRDARAPGVFARITGVKG